MSQPEPASVVIATRDRRSLLPDVLAPVLSDDATAEVLVVADGASDDTVGFLARWGQDEPRLRVISTSGVGPAAARDVGVRHARGDILVFLDDDVIVEPGVVSGHVAHHAKDSGRVVVGYMPAVRPAPLRRGDFPAVLYHELYERRCRDYEHDGENVLVGLWGGNLSVRKADLLAAGGFAGDGALRYHEDLDLGLRLRELGLTGVFDRNLRATHLHRRSVDAYLHEARAQGRALGAIARRHPDAQAALGLDPTAGLGSGARAVLDLARRPRGYRLVRVVATAALTASGIGGARRVERKLGAFLNRVERSRGLLDAARADA